MFKVEQQGRAYVESCHEISFTDNLIMTIVLKVFGIYTHAQIDRQLWESVSHQLGSRGKEYKRR